jgi:hypothetical protein
MSRDGAVLDLGRSVADHHHLLDEPVRALPGPSLRLAEGSPGAQGALDLSLQTAAGLDVQRLVDL